MTGTDTAGPAKPDAERSALWRLARLWGVEPEWTSAAGEPRSASPAALLRVLRALGAPVEPDGASTPDLLDAVRDRRRQLSSVVCPPVAVAWDGELTGLRLRTPRPPSVVDLRVRMEDGGERRCRTSDPETADEGEWIVRPRLPEALPPGYHRADFEVDGRVAGAAEGTLIISAPRRAVPLAGGEAGRPWGAFMPLYALRHDGDWGVGDLGGLRRLSEWLAGRGGSMVATLPLLAAFLDEPFRPGPYSPASRLFWNDLYLDVESAHGIGACARVAEALATPALEAERRRLRQQGAVDYRAAVALKRRVLEPLAEEVFARWGRGEDGAGREDFDRFRQDSPEAERYATFRAAVEEEGQSWPGWPADRRAGRLGAGQVASRARRYHLYAQWQLDRQMGRAGDLYLDLPLGPTADSYDVWAHREDFATGAELGAPPDPFAVEGQAWGLPPLHPERARQRGHAYLRACLRHHMRHARLLRVDHVMGLHRCWWVPEGVPPTEGAYVRYPAEELHAILALESRRHGCSVVGEDLGTVGPGVREALGRHGMYRTYVVEAEHDRGPGWPLPPVSPDSVASVQTHDMLPFATFCRERPERTAALTERLRREGWLPNEPAASADAGAGSEAQIAEEPAPAAESSLTGAPTLWGGVAAWLADGPAAAVVVALEDAWGEARRHNVPGRDDPGEHWRARAPVALERFGEVPGLEAVLRRVDRLRRGLPAATETESEAGRGGNT